MSESSIPAGYGQLRTGRVRAWVLNTEARRVAAALERFASLESWASRQPGAETWTGRGAVYVVPVRSGPRWVIRRLRHGGLLAPFTGDRFLRAGRSRPENELVLSLWLRDRGIHSPTVVAACTYLEGIWYRGEVVREEVAGKDLSACLFGSEPLEGQTRRSALYALGRLPGRLSAAGVYHPDLNLRNVLLMNGPEAGQVSILDLEKCRQVAPGGGRRRVRMLRRIRRSADRLGAQCGRMLTPDDWESIERGYRES